MTETPRPPASRAPAAPRTSSAPPSLPPPPTKSGQHPAVIAYRRKLDSLQEEALTAEALDRDLAAYLDTVKSSR